jgi:hypothetical protein
VNDEIVGGVEVDYDASGPVRPFLVIQAVCARARAGFEIQQARGSVRVRQMAHQWRGDIVTKWCHMVLRLALAMAMASEWMRLQGQMYAHMRAVMRMAAGNPPRDRNVVARTRTTLLVPSFLGSHQTLAYEGHVRGTHAKRVTRELGSRYDSHFCCSNGCENGNSDASGDGDSEVGGYDNRWCENGWVGENDAHVP